MNKKTCAIILGNRLNDDGSISDILKDRLKMAMEIEELFHPDYFILSGGVANLKAKISEAEAMYNYLVSNGFNKNKLYLEQNSLTTVENATYSLEIVKELQAEIIIVCTSPYHFADRKYLAIESFIKEIKDTNIILMTYCR